MAVKHDVTFVIVSYNSAKTLRGSIESCIAAVKESDCAKGRVVVFDNNSCDDCRNIIDEFAQNYPNIFLGIKNERNVGFGRGNNLAIAAAPSDTYVLVNPDVMFKPETVKRIHETLRSSPDIAIVCPKLLHLDKTPQKSIRRFPTFTYLFLKQFLGEKLLKRISSFDYYYDEILQTEDAVEVNWGIGAFMMVSGEYVSRYGLFDERFFLYFEDVSLCVDAWQNGYRVLYQPQATALHLYKQASTRSGFNYLTLIHIISALLFFAKYRPYQKRWQIIAWLIEVNAKLFDVTNLLIPNKKIITN